MADVLQPLTACLKRGAKLERNEQTLRAFQQIKQMMTEAPVLAIFRSDAQHIIECDSSNYACGACLKQIADDDGREQVVAYASKTLSDAQRRYCVTKKELYAIIFALSRWRHYLVGRKVIVRTDHNCLRYLLSGKCLTDQLARYLDFIADYDLIIEYSSPRCSRQWRVAKAGCSRALSCLARL
jgi:hypothetical protein